MTMDETNENENEIEIEIEMTTNGNGNGNGNNNSEKERFVTADDDYDDQEMGSIPMMRKDDGNNDPRIGALPPIQKRWTKTKYCVVLMAVLFLVGAGYQFGGIYLMEESDGLVTEPNTEINDETGGGIVSDQYDNAKIQEALDKAKAGGNAGGWFKNHVGGDNKPLDRDHLINHDGKGGAGGGGGGGHHHHYPGGNGHNVHNGGIGNHLGGNSSSAHTGGQHQQGGHHQSGSIETNESSGNNNNNNNNDGSSSSSSTTSSSSSTTTATITSVVCEDLTQYDDWHSKTITKDDGVKFEIIEQFDHDRHSFTQGLTYANGHLYESAGLWGQSTVRILDPNTADVQKKIDMDKSYFAEGMTYEGVNGTLVQFTWKSKHGFIYNASTLEVIREYEFTTTKNEGWGITWDPCNNRYIVTDGSEYIHFWDPITLTQTHKLPVNRMDGKPAKEMNEIEYWRGRILANIWHEDVIIVIDPETGIVEKEYDFSTLWPYLERHHAGADVLNGISISEVPDVLYVTGKNWNRMFKLRLLV